MEFISSTQDSFIYAVQQAYEARSKANGEFNSHLKYTPFLENTWQKPEESNLSVLKPLLEDIFKHHWHAIPHYQRHETVNLENISWFALSMATLYADIDTLLKSILDYNIPKKDAQSRELWTLITDTAKEYFYEYADLFNAYSEWKYTPKTEKKEAIDWNVRPPCGYEYRTEFKALFDEIRNARFGNKSSKPSSQSKPKEEHANKDEHKSHNPKTLDHRNKRPARPSHPNTDERLKPALEECKKAIELLKSNANIQEIPLSAQNSFIRQQQHALITAEGFQSDSRGEGGNRHVCVKTAS